MTDAIKWEECGAYTPEVSLKGGYIDAVGDFVQVKTDDDKMYLAAVLRRNRAGNPTKVLRLTDDFDSIGLWDWDESYIELFRKSGVFPAKQGSNDFLIWIPGAPDVLSGKMSVDDLHGQPYHRSVNAELRDIRVRETGESADVSSLFPDYGAVSFSRDASIFASIMVINTTKILGYYNVLCDENLDEIVLEGFKFSGMTTSLRFMENDTNRYAVFDDNLTLCGYGGDCVTKFPYKFVCAGGVACILVYDGGVTKTMSRIPTLPGYGYMMYTRKYSAPYVMIYVHRNHEFDAEKLYGYIGDYGFICIGE